MPTEPIHRIEKLIEEHVAGESVKEEFYMCVIDIMALIGKEEYGKHFNKKPNDLEGDHSS